MTIYDPYVFMLTVTDPDYWDYHGWEISDAVGILFRTREAAEAYRAEFYAEQYATYPHTTPETTAEKWAEITPLYVND
jgi:hypothetical protein